MRVNGERLHALGSINRLAEPGQAQVAAGPKQASALIKDLHRQAPCNTLEESLELEMQHMVRSQETEELREGIGSFFEKRQPDFAKLRL